MNGAVKSGPVYLVMSLISISNTSGRIVYTGVTFTKTIFLALGYIDAPQQYLLYGLPYPPLPVQGEVATTTHDIMLTCLNLTTSCNSEDDIKARESKTKAVVQQHVDDITKYGEGASDEELYAIYCKNSLAHIASYYSDTAPPQVDFKPLKSIVIGDATHTKMCEYMSAQSQLYEETPFNHAQHYMTKSYMELLGMLRDTMRKQVNFQRDCRQERESTHD